METNEFQVGDKVVYPGQGVALVLGLETREIAGRLTSFYLLHVLGGEMRILIPRGKAGKVGVRRVASEGEVDEVLEILGERDVAHAAVTWNRRYRGFMEKIRTGSLFDVAEVYRDLYRLKSQKSLSFGERRMMANARQLLLGELAVARGASAEEVAGELDRACA